MDATKTQDIHTLVREKMKENNNLRLGQAYFNAAYEIDSDFADRWRGDYVADPFHHNDNLPLFLTFWEKKENKDEQTS